MSAAVRSDDDSRTQGTLLALVAQVHAELHRTAPRGIEVKLDSALDRDLGLDSFARVELLMRVERAFGVSFPENTLELVQTPRDILAALRSASPERAPAPLSVVAPPAPQGTEGVPLDAATLPEVLDWHVARHPDRVQIVLVDDAGETPVTYAQLQAGARRVAAGLLARGLKPGQTVAIMLPTSLEYFHTYFGTLLAGGVPVPIYPPARLSQIEDHVRRHARILENALTAFLVTVSEARPVARLLEAHVPSVRHVVTVAQLDGEWDAGRVAPAAATDIAFIQYTSGSTGNPKGVVLTHANLLANVRAIGAAVVLKSDDVFVSWLPLYHDMGLIAAWLSSLYHGCRLAVMSPLAFLAHPERWLRTIHRHRGTVTAAPNFAFELCVKRIDDSRIEGLDLSSVRLLANGAEPVSPDTMTAFQRRFAPYGFRPEALAPVYGLAECTVGLLCPPLGRGPLVDAIDRVAFERDGRAVPALPDDPHPLRFAACGRPLPGHRVRIVDAAGEEVGDRIEGRLEFAGPSATSGYYRNPEQTARLRRGDWLDSGDRAYRAEGDVYITGRVKDIVIRGGRNLHPHEIEDVVGAVPGVRRGCVAVFGVTDAAAGTERLVVLAETRESGDEGRAALRQAIDAAVVDVLGEPADEVVLAPPHTVLKTSSGKVRRSATRELYAAGLVGARSRAAWWQIVRLVSTGVLRPLRDAARSAGRGLFAAWALAVFALLAPPTWLATALLPSPGAAWRFGGAAARLLFRLCRIALRVEGLEHLPRGATCVLVANHASYLDGILLVAALPPHYAFVAKRELAEHFVSRVYLQRLGAEFVERFSGSQSVADGERLLAAARHGRSLAFFPEGTFVRMPGILSFHLGAFVAAVGAGVPVVPIAIRGARSILRAGDWRPRHGALDVVIGAPVAPVAATDPFAAALALRDAARDHVLRHAGESDAARHQ